MSENTNPAHTSASHRLSPPRLSSPSPLDNHPLCPAAQPLSSSSSNSHDSSETELTMGNQLSGDGSLKRKSKKKNKNKNEEKNKSETVSVLDETVVGAFGGSPVDHASPPKRSNLAKSPRPIRSTYDNVNQNDSISNLCSNSALCTSDLYLDTVSRLDVSMTASQRNDKPYQFDTQLPDDISFSEISFCESGFITPALSTPQVKRNELQQVTPATDSVSELGKEIERTIFERLSAHGKSAVTKVKPEETAPPLPCKKDTETNVRSDVVEIPKRLEYINEEKVETKETCTPKAKVQTKAKSDNKISEVRVQSICLTHGEEDICPPENNKDREKSSEMINKADWELMEKESIKTDTKSTSSESELTEISHEKDSETTEPSKIQPNQNYPSSDECSKYDFENVKLHINEDSKVLPQDNSCNEREGAQSNDNGKNNENICPEPLEEKQTVISTPEIAANQEENVILINESETIITDGKVDLSENSYLNEEEVDTKTITDDRGEQDKNGETEVVCEAEKYSSGNVQETAAAAIATKPPIPEEILATSKADPAIKNTSVENQEPVCENLIESSSVSLVKQANISNLHSVPVLQKDPEKKSEQNKTGCAEISKDAEELVPEGNSQTNKSTKHSKDMATKQMKKTHKGTISEAGGSLECSVTQVTDTTDENKKVNSENEQNISKTKTKKGRKRKKKKKSSPGNESSANFSASESQSVSEVTEVEDDGCDLAISKSKDDYQTKDNDIESTADTSCSDSPPVFLHQSSVIENTNYVSDKIPHSDEKSEHTCSSHIQKNEQVYHKDINSKPCPTIDISCTLTALHSTSDNMSDESTPTYERQNEIRAFYIPNKELKNKAASSHAEHDNKRPIDQEEHDKSKTIGQLNDQSDIESETNQCEDESENVFDKDEDTTIVITRSPSGTKNTVEETVNPRLSTTSEELNEIMENSNKLDKRNDQSRPHSYPKENEDRRDLNETHSTTSQVSLESHHSSKKNSSKSGHTSLTDIDHNLPETLPELADLKNFLDYIKLGEDQKVSESSFPYKGETNRSSPSENASSRRLSRISPAVTERSVTESDIDISEQRDDISTDSNIFADDEDESASELLFTKTYTEPDKGGEVLVSCTVVNTAADDDSDDFWAEHSASEEVYRQIESSTKVVTTVFDNARLQMQDIHTHLQNLRLQMENLQESLDNASIFSHEYYAADDTPESSQDFYPLDKGFIVSQEYFPKHIASVTTEEYSPVELGPVLTKEYYSSHLGKPPFL